MQYSQFEVADLYWSFGTTDFLRYYVTFLLSLPFLSARHVQTKTSIQPFVRTPHAYCNDITRLMNDLRYLHCVAFGSGLIIPWLLTAPQMQKPWIRVWVHIRYAYMQVPKMDLLFIIILPYRGLGRENLLV
jgi:hypothetical protein